jgi:hypothetical protein
MEEVVDEWASTRWWRSAGVGGGVTRERREVRRRWLKPGSAQHSRPLRSHGATLPPYGLVEYGSLARRAFQTIKQVLYYENLARSEAREPNTSIYSTTFEKNHTKKYSFHLKL